MKLVNKEKKCKKKNCSLIASLTIDSSVGISDDLRVEVVNYLKKTLLRLKFALSFFIKKIIKSNDYGFKFVTSVLSIVYCFCKNILAIGLLFNFYFMTIKIENLASFTLWESFICHNLFPFIVI